MKKFFEKLKNFFITDGQQERDFSETREIKPFQSREIELPAPEIAAVFDKQSQGDQLLKRDDNVGSGTGKATSAAERKIYTSVLQTRCPYCGSEEFVKRGTRQKKRERVQLYICKSCCRTFTPSWAKGKQHPWADILEAMSYYNLGFSLAQTCQIMKQKYDKEIQPSTLASWLDQHKELCVYSRMRSFAVKEFSPYDVIETCTLAHRQLYRYRYHRAKTKYILEDDFKHYKFYPLQEFLELVPTECPHQ